MRTTRKCASFVCVTAGLVALVACNREREHTGTTRTDEHTEAREKTGTTTITGASIASNTAIDRVVASRCEREMVCKHVGADKKYASAQACSEKLHADMKDDLNAKECPRGVDQKQLNECLDAIHKEDCGNPIDVVSRLAQCRTGGLCKEH